MFFWLMFGTLIINRLMTERPLSERRYPSLAVLMVPPATGSLAWFAMHGNQITTVGIGLASILVMMALVQLFKLPTYLRGPFTITAWAFSFPMATSANTVGHWSAAASGSAGAVVTWGALVIATTIVVLLAALTLRDFPRSAYVVKLRAAAEECEPEAVGRFASTSRCAPSGGG